MLDLCYVKFFCYVRFMLCKNNIMLSLCYVKLCYVCYVINVVIKTNIVFIFINID